MNSWLYWYQKLCLQLSAAALLEVCVRFPQSAVRAKLPVIRMCGSCRAQLAVLQKLGLSSLINTFPLLIPVSDRIHDVIVVPMLAPIIMPTACASFIIPELTKPTTITVVADED